MSLDLSGFEVVRASSNTGRSSEAFTVAKSGMLNLGERAQRAHGVKIRFDENRAELLFNPKTRHCALRFLSEGKQMPGQYVVHRDLGPDGKPLRYAVRILLAAIARLNKLHFQAAVAPMVEWDEKSRVMVLDLNAALTEKESHRRIRDVSEKKALPA